MKRLVLILLTVCLTAATAHASFMGQFSGVLSSYRAPQAPNAPTGVTATAGNTQNTVNWTASAVDGTHDAATSYTLYGGTSASPTSSIYSGSSTSYTHTGLTNGTPYYYRLTASNAAGASGYSSPDATATPAYPAGLLDFETASLTPYGLTGAYVNNNSSYAVRSTTTAHGGSYSYAFTGKSAAPFNGELERTIASSGSGTVAFSRWFKFNTLTGWAAGKQIYPFGLGTVADFSSGQEILIAVTPESGRGVFYYDSGFAEHVIYPGSLIAANTWYKLSVSVNFTANTYNVTLYASDGTTVLGSASAVAPITSLAGTTKYLIIGHSNETSGVIMYVDDVMDGI